MLIPSDDATGARSDPIDDAKEALKDDAHGLLVMMLIGSWRLLLLLYYKSEKV